MNLLTVSCSYTQYLNLESNEPSYFYLFCFLVNFPFQPPIILENLETKKIVLIHGEGFGAWCWYKTMSMLEEAGLEPVALDLTGSGIDNTDINNITTLEEYSKPLLNYLNALGEGEKVIVVAHSCGGASLSFAMENCPGKISKAVFLTATMVKDGQRPFDVFTQEVSICLFIHFLCYFFVLYMLIIF